MHTKCTNYDLVLQKQILGTGQPRSSLLENIATGPMDDPKQYLVLLTEKHRNPMTPRPVDWCRL